MTESAIRQLFHAVAACAGLVLVGVFASGVGLGVWTMKRGRQ